MDLPLNSRFDAVMATCLFTFQWLCARWSNRFARSRTAVSFAIAFLLLHVSVAAIAASTSQPTASGRVVAFRASDNAALNAKVPHVVIVVPSVGACRYDMMLLDSTTNGDALMQTAELASRSGTTVSFDYTTDASGLCTITAMSNLSAAAAGATVATQRNAATAQPWAPFSGYNDAHAAAYKSAYRDVGQNKVEEAVDPQTGKLSLRSLDVVIPGPNGLDIKIFRSYSSPDPNQIAQQFANSFEPHFVGFGWQMYANFGGVRGLFHQACTSYSAITGQGVTNFDESYYFSVANLPQWIHGDGRAESLVPTSEGWRTASGIVVSCGIAAVGPSNVRAVLPDGTVVTLTALGSDAPIPGTDSGRQSHHYPTKITDRWGNWIAISYHTGYAAQPFGGILSGFQPMSLPMRQITTSDGRAVNFWYSSPRYTSPISSDLPATEMADFSLQRIDYGSGQAVASVAYEYARQSSNLSAFGWASLGKYFLKAVVRADGLRWGYVYGATTNTGLDVAPGEFALQQVIYPNGGNVSYTWGASFSRASPYLPQFVSPTWGQRRALSTQLRTKQSSDGGLWRYSYTDMERNIATQQHYDDIPDPQTGLTAVPSMWFFGDEATRISGPDSVEVLYHAPRFPLCSSSNEGFDWTTTLSSWRAGRLNRTTTYPPDVSFRGASGAEPLRDVLHTYEPVYQSVIKLLMTDQDSGMDCTNGTGFGAGTEYLARRTSSETRLGTRTAHAIFVNAESLFDSTCGRSRTITSVGTRAKRNEFTFGSYCMPLEDKLFDAALGGNLIQSISRTLTEDLKNVRVETVRGPNSTTAGLSKSFTYHATGEVASTTDSRGYAAYFSSYFRGTPQQELRPVATTDAQTESPTTRVEINRTVDDLGRVTRETDGEGRATLFEYNGVHKPTRITLAKVSTGQTLAFTYGAGMDTVTRGGRVETVSYDGFGRVTSFDNAGIVTRYRYDAAGRRTFVSYPGRPAGQSVTLDALGRAVELREPDPSSPSAEAATQIAYNDHASTVIVTNPLGHNFAYTTEAFADPTDAWVKTQSLPDVGLLVVDRNVLGQVTRVTETTNIGSVERNMTYDANRGYFLIAETHPEIGAIYYDRDNNGNATGKRVGSNSAPTTSQTFDGQNRLTSVTPANNGSQVGPGIINTWYRTGLLKSTAAGPVSRAYTYDDNNNLSTEAITIDGTTRTLSYAYDALDSLNRLTYPSGKFVDFNPDLLGRPQQVGSTSLNIVTNATYWPSGLPKKIAYANGVSQDFTEQQRPLLSALSITKTASATNHMNLGFGYDKVGNQTSTTDALALGYARNATYDAFDRILSNTGANTSESFTYEGGGDIKTKTGATFTYDTTQRRLMSIAGTVTRAFTYDTYGNAVTDGRGFGYSFDALNSLRQVKLNSTVTASYDYDGHQHLAKKVASDGTTHYLYGMNGRLFGEYLPATNKSKEYFYLGNKLVGQIAK